LEPPANPGRFIKRLALKTGRWAFSRRIAQPATPTLDLRRQDTEEMEMAEKLAA
jgi:hypothetical protein